MLVKCPCGCGHEFKINPAALLGSAKKTMSQAAIDARRANARKPRPNAKGKAKPRKAKE